jgi:hypothetical protein
MKKQVEDWILLADKDLYAAEVLLKDQYPLTNIVPQPDGIENMITLPHLKMYRFAFHAA